MRWLVLVALVGCTRGGDSGGPDDTSGGDDTGDTSTTTPEWTAARIADHDGGLQADLAIGPGGPGVVYWENSSYDDGECTEVGVGPPRRLRQRLHLAELAGSWTTEEVDDPVVAFAPTGVSLAYDTQGRPSIAYTGGVPEGQFCGANDAVLTFRDGAAWTTETAAATSGQAATGMPGSDAGFVVGLDPALAFDSDGDPAILYRDAHFGALQSDDRFRADAELAWRDGGGWTQDAVDAGEGAGEYGELLFDADGRPVAVYAITFAAQSNSRIGVWASRLDGGDWERVRLHDGEIHQEIAAGVHPTTGDVVVAFYAVDEKAVVVRTLPSGATFTGEGEWDTEIVGQAQYDEGRHVSLAFTSGGDLALAYHRCKRVSDSGSSCNANDEALIFALRDGTGWSYEEVYRGAHGSCGEFASLGIDGDTAWIAFRCTEQVDSDFVFRPWAATRDL